MGKFLLISVLIFVSTSSATAGSFASCNKTGFPNYEICKPTQNSSVLIGVYRAVKNGSWIVDETLEYVVPIELNFYRADDSPCTSPAVIEVPEGEFKDLSGVKSVRMECTKFNGTTNPFSDRYSVQRLVLLNNKLTEFPREFCAEIPFLKSLAVHHQQIKALSPASFSGMNEFLEDLNLEYIQLEVIEPETFSRFWNLKTLNLQRNRLEILRPDMFDGLHSLTALNLGDNLIRLIKPGTFASVTGLGQLYLPRNRLVNLPARIFSDLKNLEMVVLNGNAISANPSILFDGLDKLRAVYWGTNETVRLERDEPSFFSKIFSYTPVGWVISQVMS